MNFDKSPEEVMAEMIAGIEKNNKEFNEKHVIIDRKEWDEIKKIAEDIRKKLKKRKKK